jgi:hypothetical protein
MGEPVSAFKGRAKAQIRRPKLAYQADGCNKA